MSGRLELAFPDVTADALDRAIAALQVGDGQSACQFLRSTRAHRNASKTDDRDQAIRKALTFLPSELSAREKAEALALALRLYRSTRWRRDRLRETSPYEADNLDNWLWTILVCRDSALSAERIRYIARD